MNKITVNKTTLINQLRHNRDEHVEIYRAAYEAYTEKRIQELQNRLEKAQAGTLDHRDLTIFLPEPESHVEDFDTIISMLDWHEGETYDLDQHDFRQYVENRWDWERSFAANTQAYIR